MMGQAPTASTTPALAQNRVLRNTYLLLALTMVPTIAGAFLGMATAGVMLAHPMAISLAVFFGVIGLQYAIAANRNNGAGIALLLLMTGLLGWYIGPLLNFALAMRNGGFLVAYAAFGTGVILFGMGTIAATTKRDFGFLGKFLYVGMWALVLAMAANMFFQVPAVALAISSLVIVVFSLFLLYDLQRVMNGGETNYIIATTQVYMALFNIFANLLNILMALSGNRD
jgi:modulator of FtsH protease